MEKNKAEKGIRLLGGRLQFKEWCKKALPVRRHWAETGEGRGIAMQIYRRKAFQAEGTLGTVQRF